MKVGSLVYTTDQGLGILAKSFHDNGVLTDVCVVRHGKRPEHDDWYPGSPRLGALTKQAAGEAYEMCATVDVMLFFETPFIWDLIPFCREVGTKTVVMPMFECMSTIWPYQPDMILNPSHLDQVYYPNGVYLPIPVTVPWRKRERAEVFVHNAGHGGLKGRNGTQEVLTALRYIKSKADFIIRSQERIIGNGGLNTTLGGGNISYHVGDIPYENLWLNGDVFLFPEKFNGLSLPLQEARASGMLVMAGNRFPMNEWLPYEPLFPIQRFDRARVSGRCNEFDQAVYDPRMIAQEIDLWYGQDISNYSESGKVWAESMSWQVLGPKYKQLLMELTERK